MSHWRRADTGKVMCQECVPDVLSSPSDRLPARTAINGVNAITIIASSADLRSSVNPKVDRQIQPKRPSKVINQTGRSKRSSLRIKLRTAPVGRQRNQPAKAPGITIRTGHQQIIAGHASRHLESRQLSPAKPEHYTRVAQEGEGGDRTGSHGFGNPVPPGEPCERDEDVN